MTQKIIDEGLVASALGRDIPYYQDLLRRVPSTASPGNGPALRSATRGVYDALAMRIDQLNMFYAELSAQNLNSEGMLYRMAEPFSDFTQHALTLPAAIMYAALTFLLALFFVPVGCLVHHATTSQRVSRT